MKEKSKRYSAGTQRLKEVVLALLFAGRERRGKKNLIDLSDLRVCGSIAFPSRNLECYKNLIIEKNKGYELFYGLFTFGFCLQGIANEGSFHDVSRKC